MITSLEITRLRGIREGKLEDLTPLVVLVGPNACGKSTVLDALLIGASPNVGEGIGCAAVRHHGVNETARWLFWKAGRSGQSHIRITSDPSQARLCLLRLARDNRIAGVVHFSDVAEDVKLEEPIEVEFSGSDRGDWSGATTHLRGVPEMRLVESADERVQTPLDQLFQECAERGYRSRLREVISELVPGVNEVLILTEASTQGDQESARVPILHIEYSDHSVPAALAGDGIHSLLRISLELLSASGGVVLLEEPETHQHPAAIRQTVRAILAAVRRDIQVVLTTHSLELIDLILSESSAEEMEKLSVYRLKLDNGSMLSRRMSADEVAFSRMEIENDLR